MKKFFSFVLLFFTVYACNQASEPEYDNSLLQKADNHHKVIETKDTLFTMTADNGARTTFFLTGRDVTNIRAVGIIHRGPTEEPGVNLSIEDSYNMFWATYFAHTKKDPRDIWMAIENNSPTGRTGSVFMLNEPKIFVNKYLFDIGLRKVAYSDSRDKSPSAVIFYQKAFGMFSSHGGATEIDSVNNIGFPVVKLKKEPRFTSADSLWIKTEWYQRCYLPSRRFEDTVHLLVERNSQVIAVIGAAHAMHLLNDYRIKIALPLSPKDLNSTAVSLFEEEYLRKIAQK